ncbi:MAG TPA: T3SS effector HopA1 family protein [Miltoncostaeaceae bacterium]|nr:T3SS effector HopA1 family protein [Miltoncostaeaceae bacterium]
MTITEARPVSAVASAVAALEVCSPTTYSWMGEITELPEPVMRVSDAEGMRRALVGSIGARLYDSFYTQGTPQPAPRDGAARPGLDRAISHELMAANEGAGCLEPGWRVVGEDDDQRIVQRSGLRLWVARDELHAGADVGDIVALRLPADAPAYSPGFYIARGDRGFVADPWVLDRFYLDLRVEGAVPFVRETTRRLNRAGLAFLAKVADDPDGFGRRDAAVLSFERRDRPRAFAAAREIADALAPYLDAGAPAMTLPLVPGLAFAEDPGGGESFGVHRCLLLADAAVMARERGAMAPDDRFDVARERFADAGISLDTPHLGGSS